MSEICMVALKMVAFEAMESWFLDSRKIQMDGAGSFSSHVLISDVPPFDPLPRPGRFSEKGEAGLYAGVVEETADRDATPHLGPPITLDQFLDDGLQRDPVQRITGMRNAHEPMANDMGLMAEDERLIPYST
jgi:hypothetical protein